MNTFSTQLSSRPLAALIDLGGRVAIVTGGAMGIGRAIASRLHEAGALVVVADLDAAAAESTAAEFNSSRDHSALAVTADVGDAKSVETLFARTVEEFGGLDILVNNAGIYPMVHFTDMDQAAFERVLHVNLVGTFLCMKAASQQMILQGRGGKIINITSVDAVHPSMIGLAHYDASKHGVWGLTKNVALELAEHGIAVNAIAPGAVATPGTGVASVQTESEKAVTGIPAGRMAEPDEIGRVALFLASELSSYLIGSQIVVDGGMLID